MKNHGLTTDEALYLMDQIKMSFKSLHRPQSGTIHLFKSAIFSAYLKHDGYDWVNRGFKPYPHKNPVLKKCFYSLKTLQKYTNDFQRFTYEKDGLVLVHYLGNQSIADKQPSVKQKYTYYRGLEGVMVKAEPMKNVSTSS